MLFTGELAMQFPGPAWPGVEVPMEERNGMRPHASCRYTVYWWGNRFSAAGKVAPHPALEQGLAAAEQQKRPVATGRLKDEPEAPNELHPPQQSPKNSHLPRGPEESIMLASLSKSQVTPGQIQGARSRSCNLPENKHKHQRRRVTGTARFTDW